MSRWMELLAGLAALEETTATEYRCTIRDECFDSWRLRQVYTLIHPRSRVSGLLLCSTSTTTPVHKRL